jgi:hypothetical protein
MTGPVYPNVDSSSKVSYTILRKRNIFFKLMKQSVQLTKNMSLYTYRSSFSYVRLEAPVMGKDSLMTMLTVLARYGDDHLNKLHHFLKRDYNFQISEMIQLVHLCMYTNLPLYCQWR